jgi:hypothetical protein
LGSVNGHRTAFSHTLDSEKFTNGISWVQVDELHEIHTSGTSSSGEKVFRDAWSPESFIRFRNKLKQKTPFQALSGTLPPHILKTVMCGLKMDETLTVHIKLLKNRPNTTYWMHEVRGSLKDFSNLDFVIPPRTTAEQALNMIQVVIFYDDIEGSEQLADYLNNHLSSSL